VKSNDASKTVANEAAADFVSFSIDLSAWSGAPFEPLLARLQTRGILFSTLAEGQSGHPDWLSRFCDLDNSTRPGDPAVPRSLSQMAERIVFLDLEPATCFLAIQAGVYVGYTCLSRVAGDAEVLRQSWTGVRPEFQRQGIGTALKVVGAHYACLHGYRGITTQIRRSNTASVALNAAFGFTIDETFSR
jgi:GNAT superfamily N-acetyltransferase